MPAGRPPNDEIPYEATITVRLHLDEKNRLKEDASQAGLSMGELVRRQYFNRPISAKIDRTMVAELRRLGGLLKHVHNQSGGTYSSETASALSAINLFVRNLEK